MTRQRGTPTKTPTKRPRAPDWETSVAPSREGLAEVDAIASRTNQADTSYARLLEHWTAQSCPDFYSAVRSAIAAQRDLNHKYQSQVTFLANVVEAHVKKHVLSKIDEARLEKLRAGLEAKACIQGRNQAALIHERILLEAIDRVKCEDEADTLLFVCATGFRVEDLTEMSIDDLVETNTALRVQTCITKQRKKQALRVVWNRPLDRIWQKDRVLAMLKRRREKAIVAGTSLAFWRMSTKGKTKGIRSVEVGRIQDVLNALEKEVEVEDHLTSYSFRLRFLNQAIEDHRAANGSVDWEEVKQETLHIDSKTLRSAYDRLLNVVT